MIQYYLPGVDVDALSDEDLARTWAQLEYIREQELKTTAALQGLKI